MKLILSGLGLMFVFGILSVEAQVVSGNGEPYNLNCEGNFAEKIALGSETITVSTVFSANPVAGGFDWPSIVQTIKYDDGHVLLHRKFGPKLIDDMVSCDEWFAEGHTAVARAFANAPMARELRSPYGDMEVRAVQACLANLTACNADEDWRITEEVKSMTLEGFNNLIAGETRLLYLKYGAYDGSTMLFDTEQRRLVPIYQGGC